MHAGDWALSNTIMKMATGCGRRGAGPLGAVGTGWPEQPMRVMVKTAIGADLIRAILPLLSSSTPRRGRFGQRFGRPGDVDRWRVWIRFAMRPDLPAGVAAVGTQPRHSGWSPGACAPAVCRAGRDGAALGIAEGHPTPELRSRKWQATRPSQWPQFAPAGMYHPTRQ